MKTTVTNMNEMFESLRLKVCERTDAFPSLFQLALEKILFENEHNERVSCGRIRRQVEEVLNNLWSQPTMQTTPGLQTLLNENADLLHGILNAWNEQVCPGGASDSTKISFERGLAQDIFDSICHKSGEKARLEPKDITEERLQGIALEFFKMGMTGVEVIQTAGAGPPKNYRHSTEPEVDAPLSTRAADYAI